jgi:transposase
VSKVVKSAEEKGISWPLPEGTTDADLEKQLSSSPASVTTKRMPDFNYIRKELLKNGVSKKLLWTEYMEDCR